MEGMWTRFFPAAQKVKQLVQDGTLGDIKLVMADFGFKHVGTARLLKPELGGGALLDIGVYPISLSSFIFGGTPSRISAVATLGSTGIDELSAVTLVYKPEQMANLSFTILAETPKEAIIIGDKGRVRMHGPFWCSTKITVTMMDQEDQVIDFPLPEKKEGDTFNFRNSIGMQFEAAHVQKMLREKRLESDVITQQESLTIMRTMDTVREQVGLKYE